MNCPVCGLTNPDAASQCDCGYDFATKTKPVWKGANAKRNLFSTAGRTKGVNFFYLSLPTAVFGGLERVTAIQEPWSGIIALLFFASLALMIPAAIRRCHDIGRTGWLALICIIPFAAWYLVLKSGDPGLNQYGPPPGASGVVSSAVVEEQQIPCKVCDSGVLASKKIYRMSGPAVAIGYILLIPSILGIVFSGLLFAGVILSKTGASQSYQEGFDASFQRSCADTFEKSYQQQAGTLPAHTLTEQYCQCALAEYKQTNSVTEAEKICVQRAEGTLLNGNDQVQNLDSGTTSDTATQTSGGAGLFQVLGVGFAIACGVVSFVGGLVGWLLIMKKRVLQCTNCRAVINAS